MPAPISYSLLVPCYNAAKYAHKFIDNLSALTKAFDEVIFYDDASTDDTVKLLSSRGCEVVKGQINKGPGYARNQLAGKAKGDYIHFHDIDDEFNPLFLELIDHQLTKNPVDVVIGYADWVDETTRNTIIQWKYNEAGIMKDPTGYFIANPLGVINTVCRKAIFQQVSGFNEDIKCWEDADLQVRLAVAEAQYSVIDQVIAISVRHNNGISQNQARCWACRVKFLEEYKIQLDKSYHPIIGIEFEKAAYNLYTYNRFKQAIKAFHSSRNCGHNAPESNNALIKTIKKLSPVCAFILKAQLLKIKRVN